MLTREQAAEVWCPMVRTTRNQIATYEDGADQRRNPESCRCIADHCCMWRWAESRPVWQDKVVPAPELGPGGKRIVHEPVEVPTRGYCGLAGAPKIAGGLAP